MPIKKDDAEAGGGFIPAGLRPALWERLLKRSAVAIAVLIALAFMWGVGGRAIFEVFEFGWNLLQW